MFWNDGRRAVENILGGIFDTLLPPQPPAQPLFNGFSYFWGGFFEAALVLFVFICCCLGPCCTAFRVLRSLKNLFNANPMGQAQNQRPLIGQIPVANDAQIDLQEYLDQRLAQLLEQRLAQPPQAPNNMQMFEGPVQQVQIIEQYSFRKSSKPFQYVSLLIYTTFVMHFLVPVIVFSDTHALLSANPRILGWCQVFGDTGCVQFTANVLERPFVFALFWISLIALVAYKDVRRFPIALVRVKNESFSDFRDWALLHKIEYKLDRQNVILLGQKSLAIWTCYLVAPIPLTTLFFKLFRCNPIYATLLEIVIKCIFTLVMTQEAFAFETQPDAVWAKFADFCAKANEERRAEFLQRFFVQNQRIVFPLEQANDIQLQNLRQRSPSPIVANGQEPIPLPAAEQQPLAPPGRGIGPRLNPHVLRVQPFAQEQQRRQNMPRSQERRHRSITRSLSAIRLANQRRRP